MSVNLVFDGATVEDLANIIRQLIDRQRGQQSEIQRLNNETSLLGQQLLHQQGQALGEYMGGHNRDPDAHEGRITAIEAHLARTPDLTTALNNAEANLTGIVNALGSEMGDHIRHQAVP